MVEKLVRWGVTDVGLALGMSYMDRGGVLQIWEIEFRSFRHEAPNSEE